jgi:hypothetical protein
MDPVETAGPCSFYVELPVGFLYISDNRPFFALENPDIRGGMYLAYIFL